MLFFLFFATRALRRGPSVALSVPFRVSIELDAVYQRFHYSFSAGYGFIPRVVAIGATTGNSWDLPALLKYRFRHGIARPYVLAGMVVRRVSGLREMSSQTMVAYPQQLNMPVTTIQGVISSNPSVLRKHWYPGVIAGTGIEFRAGFLRLSPEIRYTRWTCECE